MNNKKILITGSAGFIGFHLALFLKSRGDFVIGCDNFNPYYDPLLKKKRAALLLEKGISVIDEDICNTSAIEKLVTDHQITHIVHLAAQAGVRYSVTHPEKYVHSNLDGFVQIMEVCKKHPHVKCVFASSSSVYGLNKKIPFAETDPTDEPASFYGATKKCNELIAKSYHNLYGISLTGLRFFTVYGPWGRPDMAYFSFTKAILEGKPLPVYGNGKLKRDFTYIDDIVKGTAAAIDLESSFEIFNLGNNKPEEVLTLISFIEEILGKKATLNFLPGPPGEVEATYADITKSQKFLGFTPKTSLKDGLTHFLTWYQNKER